MYIILIRIRHDMRNVASMAMTLYKKKTLSKIRHAKPILICSSLLYVVFYTGTIKKFYSALCTNTMPPECPDRCAMRMFADGTEQVVQQDKPETYQQCSSTPPHGLGYSLDQCPICLQPCSYEGNHERVCLIFCGHVFGRSCITQWIEHKKANAKCPNCNKKCKLKDVIRIYASPAEDGVSLTQRMKTLEAENVSLRASNAALIDIGKLNEIAYIAQREDNKKLKAMCNNRKTASYSMFQY